MKNVKPMVGQVWKSTIPVGTIISGELVSIENVNNEDDIIGIYNQAMHFSSIDFGTIERCFEFISQNDLEWLAVNVDTWDSEKKFIRTYDGMNKHNFCTIETYPKVNYYTRQQWQNKRYELGLDEKETEMNTEQTPPKPSKELVDLLHQEVGFSGLDDLIKPVETPVFTQAMANDHIPPPIGSMFKVDKVEKDSRILDFLEVEVEVIGLCSYEDDLTIITFIHPTIGIGCGVYYSHWVKPIQTDEDKLKEALVGVIWDGTCLEAKGSVGEDIDKVLASDKFTITLNKE